MFEPVAVDFTKANCKDQPTIWWFPEWPPTREKTRQWKQAKAICSECDMKKECLAYGQSTYSYGIWGGVTLQNGRIDKRKKEQK